MTLNVIPNSWVHKLKMHEQMAYARFLLSDIISFSNKAWEWQVQYKLFLIHRQSHAYEQVLSQEFMCKLLRTQNQVLIETVLQGGEVLSIRAWHGVSANASDYLLHWSLSSRRVIMQWIIQLYMYYLLSQQLRDRFYFHAEFMRTKRSSHLHIDSVDRGRI